MPLVTRSRVDSAVDRVARNQHRVDELNAVLADLAARGEELPLLRDFGPTGDGTTDDGPGLAALATGFYLGTVGTYRISTATTLPAGVRLLLVGGVLAPDVSVTLTLGAGAAVFHVGTGIGGSGTVTAGAGTLVDLSLAGTALQPSGNLSGLASVATARTNLGLGALATKTQASLTADVTGNLPVGNLNSGSGAGAATYWRGDGTWANPTTSSSVYLVATALQTSAYTAAAADLVRTDTTSAAFTVTLPATPADGTIVGVFDSTGAWSTHNLTVARGAATIDGAAANRVLSIPGEVHFRYRTTTTNWATAYQPRVVGGAAALNVGTTTGTVAAGDDSRITGAAQKASNLSDLASAATARTNLGLGTVATLASTAVLQSANNLSDLASTTTARTNLALGPFATVASGGTFSPFKLTDITIQTAAFTLAAATHTGCRIPCNLTAGFTITVPSAATLTNGFGCEVVNIGTSGTITLNGPGATNVTLTAGQACQIIVTGAVLYTTPVITLTAI